jgi:uncharacterized protein YecE (DUF72 family)
VLLPGEELDLYLDAMRELGPRAGPLVIQLPYFNREAFASLQAFLDRLGPFLETLPADFRYGVEVRNKAWIAPPLLEMLRARRIALVLVDLSYMPHPADIAHDLVTTDFLYVRLIGDRAAVEAKTTTFDQIVIDQDARLARWAEYMADLLPRVIDVYTYANNHFAGYGVDTIRTLERLLRTG